MAEKEHTAMVEAERRLETVREEVREEMGKRLAEVRTQLEQVTAELEEAKLHR